MRKKTKAEIMADYVANGRLIKQISFPAWCASRGFSESTGRNMHKAELGPKRTTVGRLVFVTPEADAEWYLMWELGGEEQFKTWGREQRKLREQRKQQSAA